MAATVDYRVLDPRAPIAAVMPDLRRIAGALRDDAAAGTPVDTGAMRRGWEVVPGGSNGWRVINTVDWAPFVEYGTKHMRPRAPLGRALARAQARWSA